MKHFAISAANEFIRLGRRDDVLVTNMKLQKLLYFLQGHGLALAGENLLDEQPQAWQYGPVYPSVYRYFKDYGASPILKEVPFPFDDDDEPWRMNAEDLKAQSILEAVWRAYKDMPATKLSQLTHVPGGPWEKAAKQGRSAVISEEAMREYFSATGAN